ncbi:photosystem reaction center subunit H [Subsaximicrobium wynnwilliamsii]|jgi:hypothetical protein|uniref:Photosystem reaction center subunit H n=1 Tax=Subsaximicrobium wynnwilliamsii TaxID=291179 RepID=A0A5C6ZJ08_9FLAO|nr:photosystem reaction center subunit H [Subsaximicrobium wynnwilliamsii]TXD84272.1 photosystem reaction center subunit H [Subsaximicrobium wynnwilliamsii]TXD89893.1 photosystem reaction center subunit H [Subsaximicrobium wynnwilliamsii]TXE03984.1 photosystem reaction center subunit H [Subsaximicrobium wynnwilliamsii]
MGTDKERNLYYLEELSDYKVADSDMDVRGWEVKDKDERVIGTVDNLLVNKSTERVVYLDIEVDASIIEANHKPYNIREKDGVHGFLNKDGENHLILPVGLAQLHLESELVSTENINHKTFAETKRIKKGTAIDRDYEVVVLDSYVRSDEAKAYPKDDKFYQSEAFGGK